MRDLQEEALISPRSQKTLQWLCRPDDTCVWRRAPLCKMMRALNSVLGDGFYEIKGAGGLENRTGLNVSWLDLPQMNSMRCCVCGTLKDELSLSGLWKSFDWNNGMRGSTWRNSRLNEHLVYFSIGLSNNKTQTSLPPWCLPCCTTDCLRLRLARLMFFNVIQVEGAAQSSAEAARWKAPSALGHSWQPWAHVGNLLSSQILQDETDRCLLPVPDAPDPGYSFWNLCPKTDSTTGEMLSWLKAARAQCGETSEVIYKKKKKKNRRTN